MFADTRWRIVWSWHPARPFTDRGDYDDFLDLVWLRHECADGTQCRVQNPPSRLRGQEGQDRHGRALRTDVDWVHAFRDSQHHRHRHPELVEGAPCSSSGSSARSSAPWGCTASSSTTAQWAHVPRCLWRCSVLESSSRQPPTSSTPPARKRSGS